MTTIHATFHQRSHAVAAVNAFGQVGFARDVKMPPPIDPDFDVSAQPAASPAAAESGSTAVKGAAIGALSGLEPPHNVKEAEAGFLLERKVDDPLAKQRALDIFHARTTLRAAG